MSVYVGGLCILGGCGVGVELRRILCCPKILLKSHAWNNSLPQSGTHYALLIGAAFPF